MSKIKVLHIIGGMNRCGAETFLMNIFREIDKQKFEFYFLCYGKQKYDYENEIEQLGGKIIRIDSLKKSGLRKFSKDIKKVIKKYEINVLHAHTYYNSAIPLLIAKKEKVKIRIVHAHSTMSAYRCSAFKRIYNFISKIIINRSANVFVACSEEAGKSLFFKSKNIRIIENGIDLKKFKFNVTKRKEIKKILGISDEDLVLGHVGRFEPEKNHKFIIEVFENLLKKKSEMKLILIGNGSKYNDIDNICKEKGINDKVIFLGNIPNVNEVMNAFDIFIFPSLFEGLGIALIEAQANGIPCFASMEVPKKADISNRIEFIDLREKPGVWANKILNANLDRYQIEFENCKYDSKNSAKLVMKIYTDNKE